MKKILNPREFIENNQGATIQLYIEYLRKEKEEALESYSKVLSKEQDSSKKANQIKDILFTVNEINRIMKSIENNLDMILVQKLNEIDGNAILTSDDKSTIDEINSLIEILKSIDTPEDFTRELISKAEAITSTVKSIKNTEEEIAEKDTQYEFLGRYTNASDLFRRATILQDGLLISCFGSLAEPSKPFADAETRRLTQIEKMVSYMNMLESIQKEYEEAKNSATGFFERQKKSYKEKLRSIRERYNNVLQESVKYFQSHPEILCVAQSDDKIEHPTIECFDDLKKASENQRLSIPTKSDFMEVADEFDEAELCQAIAIMRELNKYIFQFEQGEDGFYTFTLDPEAREQLRSAQSLVTKYFKMVYDKRFEREELIRCTPQLPKKNWEEYESITKILGFSPSTTDQVKDGMQRIRTESLRLKAENTEQKERLIALCGDQITCPESLAETIDDHTDIEELYHSSISEKQKAKVNQ